jgi:hypothetical protein
MKTGRLIKFRRAEADVHPAGASLPAFRGDSEDAVEAEVRAWIEAHYPGRLR